eukprot:4628505-Prymnesium_polylepis.3
MSTHTRATAHVSTQQGCAHTNPNPHTAAHTPVSTPHVSKTVSKTHPLLFELLAPHEPRRHRRLLPVAHERALLRAQVDRGRAQRRQLAEIVVSASAAGALAARRGGHHLVEVRAVDARLTCSLPHTRAGV